MHSMFGYIASMHLTICMATMALRQVQGTSTRCAGSAPWVWSAPCLHRAECKGRCLKIDRTLHVSGMAGMMVQLIGFVGGWGG
jgi:hypothetical protein